MRDECFEKRNAHRRGLKAFCFSKCLSHGGGKIRLYNITSKYTKNRDQAFYSLGYYNILRLSMCTYWGWEGWGDKSHSPI